MLSYNSSVTFDNVFHFGENGCSFESLVNKLFEWISISIWSFKQLGHTDSKIESGITFCETKILPKNITGK